jgi:hypothetical protein
VLCISRCGWLGIMNNIIFSNLGRQTTQKLAVYGLSH